MAGNIRFIMPPTNWLLFDQPAWPLANAARSSLACAGNSGAVSLRDGVVVLPATDHNPGQVGAVGGQIEQAGGVVWLLELAAQRPGVEEQLRGAIRPRGSYAELERAWPACVRNCPSSTGVGGQSCANYSAICNP